MGLSSGFGLQIGLFTYLRTLHSQPSGKVVAVSGATSGIAMVACCSHYLVNIVPVIGISVLAAIIGILLFPKIDNQSERIKLVIQDISPRVFEWDLK